MDDYTLAKRLFNGKSGSNGDSGSAFSNSVTTFEALALTDSVDGYVTIDMGGMVTSGDNNQGVTVPTTVVVKKGQTVIVQNSGGSLVVIGVVGGEDGLKGDLEKDVADKIAEAGDKIQAQVDEELGPLRDSFEQFKQDHQFTDEDITVEINKTKTELETQISGAIETSDAAFTSATTAQQTVESFKTEVNQKFVDYDEGVAELKTSIEQNAENIATEVTLREEAVNGALSDAKSYTDQKANEISQTVEKNVMNSVGNKFATKTELTQTSEDLTLTINQEVSTVQNTVNSALSTANTANSNANSAKNTANSALSKAEEIETYFSFTTSGLKVGRTGEKGAVRVASDGSFEVLYNNNNMLDIDYNSSYSRSEITAPWLGKIAIVTNNNSTATFSNSGYTFSSMQPGFSINNLCATEVYGFSSTSTTSSFTKSIGSIITKPSYVVIYYRTNFDGSCYRSIKLDLSRGETHVTSLIDIFNGGTNLVMFSERITVYFSASNRLKITRGAPARASISSSGSGYNSSPGTTFYIDYVTICG